MSKYTHPLRPAAALLLLLMLASAASAHDTWFEAKTSKRSGRIIMALGTGNQFPVMETPIDLAYLPVHACQQGSKPLPLQGLAMTAKALLMMTQAEGDGDGEGPISCWAQSAAFELELAPDKIELYFAEVNPPPALRAHWAALQARGLPWRERYVKHARIELASERLSAATSAATPTAALMPAVSGIGMDLLMSSQQPARSGADLAFQVLRDGAPLPDFALELRAAEPPAEAGQWLRTDAQGMLRIKAPAAGHWLLRGIDLRISPTRPDEWDSRFITLAFEVR